MMDGVNLGMVTGEKTVPTKPLFVINENTPSFTEIPWILRVDLKDPAVQEELRRQMEIVENSEDEQAFIEEMAELHEKLLQELRP